MNFEHLIEINDASLPDLQPLTRSQLWRGLVIRAEKPQLSVIGLDDCRILERGDGFLKRELRFGHLQVRDRVRLMPLQSVTYETEASGEMAASRLIMAIEEPWPERLFVRFTYADVLGPAAGAMDQFYDEHRKQAYLFADIDTIATIRRLASEGLLAEEDA
ncbi:MAG: hypothetical protein H6R11_2176 [Proteobacteria bacterium]|nr:hypothetical protein [Pseudomonadota bacterium]